MKVIVWGLRQVKRFASEKENNDKPQRTIICLAYPSDFNELYSFWCARYENISIEEFLNIGITEFNIKISSIPENEPLFRLIRSLTVKLSKIKNKEERKYWAELKRMNKIPQIYLSSRELDGILKQEVRESGINKVL